MSLDSLQQAVGQMLKQADGEVVIVYEDFASGLKAKQVFDQVITPWDPDSKHRFKMWDFSGLRIDSLRGRAVKDAVAASIVCVSLGANGELPPAVKDWAEKWTSQMTERDRSLVALLEPADDLFADQTPVLDFLRDIAQRASAQFLIVRADHFGKQENTYAQEPLNCV